MRISWLSSYFSLVDVTILTTFVICLGLELTRGRSLNIIGPLARDPHLKQLGDEVKPEHLEQYNRLHQEQQRILSMQQETTNGTPKQVGITTGGKSTTASKEAGATKMLKAKAEPKAHTGKPTNAKEASAAERPLKKARVEQSAKTVAAASLQSHVPKANNTATAAKKASVEAPVKGIVDTNEGTAPAVPTGLESNDGKKEQSPTVDMQREAKPMETVVGEKKGGAAAPETGAAAAVAPGVDKTQERLIGTPPEQSDTGKAILSPAAPQLLSQPQAMKL